MPGRHTEANVGGADRSLRWIVGVTLLIVAFVLDMAAGWRLLASSSQRSSRSTHP